MGLAFDLKDLYNFHTSVKSAKLTILAGMSGTGKSKLVQAYSRALRLDPLIIPVRPSWSDDADLIGYVDSMNMVYRPGDSRLINTLIQAENDHKNLYIICFDEMNLARVEHYFSQFLSVLEMDANDRKLRLYNPELSDRLYNHIQYPSEVKIGENVLFIGTVNLDESTYHFSDKVLDRANVIELGIIPFKQMRDIIEEQKDKIDRKFTNWSFQDFNGFRNRSKDNKEKEKVELTDIEVSFLWDIHIDLNRTNKNLGIGPRIVRQIDTYLKNLPANQYLTRKQAFDIQIKQRILTKLRGPEDQLKDLLSLHEGQLIGKLQEQILKYKDVSEFEVTRNTLIQKAKELSSNGYTV
ncbi:AAA family ATPase [Brevibacillus sp. MS2.2]|nr:AAA family ATPase [Brevibacillus sp. MS2.2]